MQQLRLTMILIPDKMYGVLKKAMFREYFWLNLPKCRYYRLKEKATRSWQRHLEVAGAEAPVAFRLWEGGKGHKIISRLKGVYQSPVSTYTQMPQV